MKRLKHMFSDPSTSVEVAGTRWWSEDLDPQPLRVPRDILEEFPELPVWLRLQPPEPFASRSSASRPEPSNVPGEKRFGKQFARTVGEEGRRLVAELVDEHWLWWCDYLYSTLVARHPDLLGRLEKAWERGSLTASPSFPNAVVYSAKAAQLFYWGAWDPPRQVTCILCARGYGVEWVANAHLRRGIDYRFCPHCALAVYPGMDDAARAEASKLTNDEFAERLHRLSKVIGSVPGVDLWTDPSIHGFTNIQKVRLVACLMITPHVDMYFERFGRPWTRVLMATSVIEGGRITSRGTMSVANDGHLCRSVGERLIDDFFTEVGIAHETEPDWPAHPTYNPSGRKRADWLLVDGTYVEYAGLAGDKAYDRKMEGKVAMARELGIDLEVVFPRDLRNLRARFARHLEPPSS